MSHRERTWVMVLAGGGASLHESQKGEVDGPDRGQLRALPGRPSLLKMTLSRARSIVPSERICVVIDRAQQRHWSASLEKLPGGNVIVQPFQRLARQLSAMGCPLAHAANWIPLKSILEWAFI